MMKTILMTPSRLSLMHPRSKNRLFQRSTATERLSSRDKYSAIAALHEYLATPYLTQVHAPTFAHMPRASSPMQAEEKLQKQLV